MSVRAVRRSLSRASAALEMSSRRKMSVWGTGATAEGKRKGEKK